MNIMPHGWMAKMTMGRPKARICGFLAVVWAGVAIIGAALLWQDLDGAQEPGLRLLAWVLMLPELAFIVLAVFFRLTEAPRSIPAPPDDRYGPILY